MVFVNANYTKNKYTVQHGLYTDKQYNNQKPTRIFIGSRFTQRRRERGDPMMARSARRCGCNGKYIAGLCRQMGEYFLASRLGKAQPWHA